MGKAGERIPRAGDEARHALEHSGKPLLVCAESNENGAMVLDISVGHVAAKDVPKFILIRAGHMRVYWLISSSTLSGLVRPIIRSCCSTGKASHAVTWCFHF